MCAIAYEFKLSPFVGWSIKVCGLRKSVPVEERESFVRWSINFFLNDFYEGSESVEKFTR